MGNVLSRKAIDDTELARRSNTQFGEMFARLGQGVDPEAVIRLPNAIGARFDPEIRPGFFSSVVVPVGATPPVEDLGTHYVWTDGDAVAGRVEDPEMAFPTMGLELNDPALNFDDSATTVESPSFEELAVINERAHGKTGFKPVAAAIKDDRIHAHGLREDDQFVCVAMTISLGDDLGIHYVATDKNYRRRGLASTLVKKLLENGRKKGMRSATLQATKQGLPVWERIGFRRVGMIRPYTRAPLIK